MKLKIGYRTYRMEPMKDEHSSGTEATGQCFVDRGLILVSPKPPADEVADTIIHETLHAIWAERGLKGELDEETVVTALAHGLTAVMADNPDWLKAVQDALSGRLPKALRKP